MEGSKAGRTEGRQAGSEGERKEGAKGGTNRMILYTVHVCLSRDMMGLHCDVMSCVVINVCIQVIYCTRAYICAWLLIVAKPRPSLSRPWRWPHGTESSESGGRCCWSQARCCPPESLSRKHSSQSANQQQILTHE